MLREDHCLHGVKMLHGTSWDMLACRWDVRCYVKIIVWVKMLLHCHHVPKPKAKPVADAICATMALAVYPKKDLFPATGRLLYKEAFRWTCYEKRVLMNQTCKFENIFIKNPHLLRFENRFAQIPVRHHVPFRAALLIRNTHSTANEGPVNHPDGCLSWHIFDGGYSWFSSDFLDQLGCAVPGIGWPGQVTPAAPAVCKSGRVAALMAPKLCSQAASGANDLFCLVGYFENVKMCLYIEIRARIFVFCWGLFGDVMPRLSSLNSSRCLLCETVLRDQPA